MTCEIEVDLEIPGPMGPARPGQTLFIADDEPEIPAGTTALWVQTGLGDDGQGITLYLKTEPA